MRVLFLSQQKPSDTNRPTKQRCQHPAEWLTSVGVESEVRWLYSRQTNLSADIIILSRAVLDNYTNRLIKRAKAKGSIIAYEIDDLLFEEMSSEYLLKIGREAHAKQVKARQDAIAACDCVIVSTTYLANVVKKHSKEVWVQKNGLSKKFLQAANQAYLDRQDKHTLTLGYFSGSSTHDHDFSQISDILVKVMQKHSHVRLLIMGALKVPSILLELGKRVEIRNYVPHSHLPHEIAKVDINLVPLEIDDSFCQAKSELKYYEAGACGVPTLATATSAYAEAIKHGVNGFLASMPEQWESTLESVITQPQLLREVGVRARADVIQKYSPETRAREWQATIAQIKEKYSPISHIRKQFIKALLLELIERTATLKDFLK